MNKNLTLQISSDCYLHGASQKLLEAIRLQLTIDNPKYKDAKKYSRWVGKKLKKKLYFFDLEENGIHFPRGFTRHAIELCKKHMGRAPVIIDDRRVLPEVDFEFKGKLRPYQKEAVGEILKKHFGVLVSGTGSGKTVMALAIIAARRQPTLILLHSKELMYQWRDRVYEFLGIEPGLIGDGHYEISPVSIAIVNTARKKLHELPQHFGHIVVDECHRVPASLFTGVVKAFDSQFTLGLSATAYRREDGLTRLIYLFMGDRRHEVDSGKLAATGAVLQPIFDQRNTSFRYFFKGDYQALMTALTADEDRNIKIADDISAEVVNNKGTILVVSDRVAHCENLALLLVERGIKAQVLTGRLSAEERSQIVDDVRSGTVKVLISTLQLVGEGFDASGLTTLFLTTPIKFSGRLKQVIGRVLRPAKGKQAKVIDYVDSHVGVLKNSGRLRMKTYQNLSGDDSKPQELW